MDLQNKYQYRERQPTKKEYEQYLRANPEVLTTGKESLDLIIASSLLFLVFGLRPLLSGGQGLYTAIILTLIIAPAFILHELSHKYTAIYFGKYARFTLIRQMTILTVVVAVIGFGIAGPGATMIMGKSSKRENGIFAAAGPAMNFLISVLLYVLILIVPEFIILGVTFVQILKLGIYINAFFALFNLIPISLLDGKKILSWNILVWGMLVILNIFAFIYSSNILSEIKLF